MIKKQLRCKKGASSIMVMLILVVLVVFGVAALTTALSNLRLGQKVAGWNEKYYAAESEANITYAMIDKAVLSCGAGAGFDAIKESVESLGLGAVVEAEGGVVLIRYETWSEDIGISVVLSLKADDTESINPVEWREIQR